MVIASTPDGVAQVPVPGWRHCVVFLDNLDFDCHSAFLHPGVRRGSGELNAEG